MYNIDIDPHAPPPGWLLMELRPLALTAVRRLIRNEADAEDAVQDAMLALSSDWPGAVAFALARASDGDVNQVCRMLVGFLLTVAKRSHRARVKRHGPEAMDPSARAAHAVCPPHQGADIDFSNLLSDLRREIERLSSGSEADRIMVEGKREGLSNREIGEKLGTSPNGSALRWHRFKRRHGGDEKLARLAKSLNAARHGGYAGGDDNETMNAVLVSADGEPRRVLFDTDGLRWHADGRLSGQLTAPQASSPMPAVVLGIALLRSSLTSSERIPSSLFIAAFRGEDGAWVGALDTYVGEPPFSDPSGDGVVFPAHRVELALVG